MSKNFPTFVLVGKSAIFHFLLAAAFGMFSIIASRRYCMHFEECKAGVLFESYGSLIAFSAAGVFACIAAVIVVRPLLMSKPKFFGTESIPALDLYHSPLLAPRLPVESWHNPQLPVEFSIESTENDG